jgi:hypothetical protein
MRGLCGGGNRRDGRGCLGDQAGDADRTSYARPLEIKKSPPYDDQFEVDAAGN